MQPVLVLQELGCGRFRHQAAPAVLLCEVLHNESCSTGLSECWSIAGAGMCLFGAKRRRSEMLIISVGVQQDDVQVSSEWPAGMLAGPQERGCASIQAALMVQQ